MTIFRLPIGVVDVVRVIGMIVRNEYWDERTSLVNNNTDPEHGKAQTHSPIASQSLQASVPAGNVTPNTGRPRALQAQTQNSLKATLLVSIDCGFSPLCL
jgi:hypothetical protein